MSFALWAFFFGKESCPPVHLPFPPQKSWEGAVSPAPLPPTHFAHVSAAVAPLSRPTPAPRRPCGGTSFPRHFAPRALSRPLRVTCRRAPQRRSGAPSAGRAEGDAKRISWSAQSARGGSTWRTAAANSQSPFPRACAQPSPCSTPGRDRGPGPAFVGSGGVCAWVVRGLLDWRARAGERRCTGGGRRGSYGGDRLRGPWCRCRMPHPDLPPPLDGADSLASLRAGARRRRSRSTRVGGSWISKTCGTK